MSVKSNQDTPTKPQLSKEEVDKQMVELSVATFFKGDRLLRGTSKASGKKVSRKAIIRAIRYALNVQVTDQNIKLRNDAEKVLAASIYEMLAARVIMRAHLIKQAGDSAEEINNGNTKEKADTNVEETELGRNRDSTSS